ncbi:MAG: enoyl-CoA hydratase-related protein, partial [Acidimicrobiia bacterium]|nr:enoyl-CoA hydratase-related protein [Acidimicrobiia bacterium]
QADAASAFLRGNRFPAAEAVSLGLINEAAGADTLDQRIDAIVADLLEGGPEALAAAKRLLSAVPSMPFDQALKWAAGVSADLFKGAEGQEGMTAYLEKRPPDWSPRSH